MAATQLNSSKLAATAAKFIIFDYIHAQIHMHTIIFNVNGLHFVLQDLNLNVYDGYQHQQMLFDVHI